MIYVFDDCKLDTHLYNLERLGETIQLSPKVFQVLIYLLEHRDRVVSKQELSERLWPEQFISDGTLESTVRSIRRVLGDNRHTQRMIQTFRGHGYRFVASITQHGEAHDSQTNQDENIGSALSAVPTPSPVKTALASDLFELAEPLIGRCPTCQHIHDVPHATQDKFCRACGNVLSGPALNGQLSSAVPAPRARPEAEHRQLTVMSCNLVDAIAMPGQFELEDVLEIIRAYHETCGAVVRQFDGYIAQNLATGLLVYFGYPLAHEDDAHRAIHTGLGIIKALATLNAGLMHEKGLRLAVRLGIHTGRVIVGDLDRESQPTILALGETPHITAQIQGMAAPDTVVISAATARLVQGFFEYQTLGLHTLEGLSTPMRLAQVLGPSTAQNRLEANGLGSLTPLVGRDAEKAFLVERWARIIDGLGHVVLLSGEPGIGKSRLVQFMKNHVCEASGIWIEGRGSPYHQHSALYPVIDLLQRFLEWQQDDVPDGKLQRLESLLSSYALPLQDMVPLLAALLGLPVPEQRYPLLQGTPQQQRQRTLEAIVTLMLALACQQALLLIIEDLHWVDPSTLELLTLLVDQVPTTQLCLLCTSRPTFQAPWSHCSYFTQIPLPRLNRSQVAQMVQHLTGGKVLPPEMFSQVVDKTDGVPLFVEELTKTVLETGLLREAEDRYELTVPLPGYVIPTTLHDSLMARLDHLDTAKRVAQLGATIGRQFPYTLLQAVWGQDEANLQRELRRLVEAELMYQRGLPPQAIYIFKHTLVQETAYQSLLKRTRQRYHQHIAQVLTEQFAETLELQPELVAHHYTEAGLAAQAIPYWQQAGERAAHHSAHVEAIAHLNKGLELLATLPDTPDRVQRELTLQCTLGVSLLAIKYFSAVEVEQAYTRARVLCQQVGETRQIFPVLFGLWGLYETRGELHTARELADQFLSLAHRHQDPSLILQGHRAMGDTLYWLGEFVPARLHLEQGIALYDPQLHHTHAFLYGQDPAIGCLIYTALVLWILGYPDQSLQRCHEAIGLAQALSHPFSLAYTLNFAAALYRLRREWQEVHACAEQLMALAAKQGFSQLLDRGRYTRGTALVMQGQIEEGMTQIQQGLSNLRDTGAGLNQSSRLTMLAQVYGVAGHTAKGIQTLEDALRVAHKTGARVYQTERYRLKGELLLALTPQNWQEAETHFLAALDLARRQQAKSFELRAVISLSRLWQRQGKAREARHLLATIYHWFTEGLHTADIQEAHALLQELE